MGSRPGTGTSPAGCGLLLASFFVQKDEAVSQSFLLFSVSMETVRLPLLASGNVRRSQS